MKKTAFLKFLFATTIFFVPSISASDMSDMFVANKEQSLSTKKPASTFKRLAIGTVFVSAAAAATYYYKDYIKGIIPFVQNLYDNNPRIVTLSDEDRSAFIEKVAAQFATENKQFEQLRAEQKAAKEELDNLRSEIEKEKKAAQDEVLGLGQINHELTQINHELTQKEERFLELTAHVKTLNTQVQEKLSEVLEEKLKTLQETFEQRLQDLQNTAQSQQEAFEQRLQNLHQDQSGVSSQTNQTIEELKKEVSSLNEHVHYLSQPQKTRDLFFELTDRITTQAMSVICATAQEAKTFAKEKTLPFITAKAHEISSKPGTFGKLNVNPEYQGCDFSPLG